MSAQATVYARLQRNCANRVPQGALERLERYEEKFSRTVLRGGENGNVPLLTRPRTKAKGNKKVKGFQIGDRVKVIVTTGTKQGTYVGRVAGRATGSFNIVTSTQTVQGISHRFCQMLHCADGYSFSEGGALLPMHECRGIRAIDKR